MLKRIISLICCLTLFVNICASSQAFAMDPEDEAGDRSSPPSKPNLTSVEDKDKDKDKKKNKGKEKAKEEEEEEEDGADQKSKQEKHPLDEVDLTDDESGPKYDKTARETQLIASRREINRWLLNQRKPFPFRETALLSYDHPDSKASKNKKRPDVFSDDLFFHNLDKYLLLEDTPTFWGMVKNITLSLPGTPAIVQTCAVTLYVGGNLAHIPTSGILEISVLVWITTTMAPVFAMKTFNGIQDIWEWYNEKGIKTAPKEQNGRMSEPYCFRKSIKHWLAYGGGLVAAILYGGQPTAIFIEAEKGPFPAFGAAFSPFGWVFTSLLYFTEIKETIDYYFVKNAFGTNKLTMNKRELLVNRIEELQKTLNISHNERIVTKIFKIYKDERHRKKAQQKAKRLAEKYDDDSEPSSVSEKEISLFSFLMLLDGNSLGKSSFDDKVNSLRIGRGDGKVPDLSSGTINTTDDEDNKNDPENNDDSAFLFNTNKALKQHHPSLEENISKGITPQLEGIGAVSRVFINYFTIHSIRSSLFVSTGVIADSCIDIIAAGLLTILQLSLESAIHIRNIKDTAGLFSKYHVEDFRGIRIVFRIIALANAVLSTTFPSVSLGLTPMDNIETAIQAPLIATGAGLNTSVQYSIIRKSYNDVFTSVITCSESENISLKRKLAYLNEKAEKIKKYILFYFDDETIENIFSLIQRGA